jgi:hypothetical protein
LTVVSWHSTTRSMLTFLKIPCTFISAMSSIPRTFFRDYLTSQQFSMLYITGPSCLLCDRQIKGIGTSISHTLKGQWHAK